MMRGNWRLVILGIILGSYIVEFLVFLVRTEGQRDIFHTGQFLITCITMVAYFALTIALHKEFEPIQKLWYRVMNVSAALMTVISLSVIVSPVLRYAY